MHLHPLWTMSPGTLFVVGLALSSALLSGLLFVFSNFAMKAFDQLPAAASISAMQSINARIMNPGFLGLFAGTAAGSLLALAGALRYWQHPASIWIVAGSVLLLIGLYAVTAGINVPLNHQLDGVDPADPDAAIAWRSYLARWQPWNHVRTISAFLAAAAFAIGALQMVGGH